MALAFLHYHALFELSKLTLAYCPAFCSLAQADTHSIYN